MIVRYSLKHAVGKMFPGYMGKELVPDGWIGGYDMGTSVVLGLGTVLGFFDSDCQHYYQEHPTWIHSKYTREFPKGTIITFIQNSLESGK